MLLRDSNTCLAEGIASKSPLDTLPKPSPAPSVLLPPQASREPQVAVPQESQPSLTANQPGQQPQQQPQVAIPPKSQPPPPANQTQRQRQRQQQRQPEPPAPQIQYATPLLRLPSVHVNPNDTFTATVNAAIVRYDVGLRERWFMRHDLGFQDALARVRAVSKPQLWGPRKVGFRAPWVTTWAALTEADQKYSISIVAMGPRAHQIRPILSRLTNHDQAVWIGNFMSAPALDITGMGGPPKLKEDVASAKFDIVVSRGGQEPAPALSFAYEDGNPIQDPETIVVWQLWESWNPY
ncbi:MAG: hypothetical protein M1825_001004 [Sarcosagium campestre]|nr:MAG: hypothetical protein M1825_001004 [Sarcosagium campestre]